MAKMKNEVQALTHFPFANKQRKPGDVISPQDWALATEAVQASLIGQGFVRILDGAGANSAPAAAGDESEASTDAIQLLQGISGKLDRLLSIVAPGSVPEAPAKITKKRVRTDRSAAAK